MAFYFYSQYSNICVCVHVRTCVCKDLKSINGILDQVQQKQTLRGEFKGRPFIKEVLPRVPSKGIKKAGQREVRKPSRGVISCEGPATLSPLTSTTVSWSQKLYSINYTTVCPNWRQRSWASVSCWLRAAREGC